MKKKTITMVLFALFLFAAGSAQVNFDGPLPVPIPHVR
jgi:hypothetical protein